jgi:hypothetical protein
VSEDFWKEHERRLSDAEAARRSRQQRIRETCLEIMKMEATKNAVLHAIDGVWSVAKPLVESMLDQPDKERQKKTEKDSPDSTKQVKADKADSISH